MQLGHPKTSTCVTQGTSLFHSEGIFAAVLHQSGTQGGDATGTLTKSLLRNSGRGKAQLETPWLLLIHGITRIRECDMVRDMLLGVCTGTFCGAAASPSQLAPPTALALALAAALQHQNRFPEVGANPSLTWHLGIHHWRSPARRQRGWMPLCPPAPLNRQHGPNPDIRDKVGNAKDNVQTCDKAMWPSERGQDPSPPPLLCLLNTLSRFRSWMLNCPFLLSFISPFPERGSLFLTCQHRPGGT